MVRPKCCITRGHLLRACQLRVFTVQFRFSKGNCPEVITMLEVAVSAFWMSWIGYAWMTGSKCSIRINRLDSLQSMYVVLPQCQYAIAHRRRCVHCWCTCKWPRIYYWRNFGNALCVLCTASGLQFLQFRLPRNSAYLEISSSFSNLSKQGITVYGQKTTILYHLIH